MEPSESEVYLHAEESSCASLVPVASLETSALIVKTLAAWRYFSKVREHTTEGLGKQGW